MIASLALLACSVVPAQSDSGSSSAASSAPAGVPYTFAEFDFVATDIDGFSDDPDGIALHGSYALDPSWFVFGGLEHLGGRAGGSSIDLDTLHAGAGYHTPIAARTDLVLRGALGYASVDSGSPGGTSDGLGYLVGAGVRHRATDALEVDVGLDYRDFEHSDGDTALRLGAVYYAAPHIGFTAQLSASDEVDSFRIGLRWTP